MLRRTAAILALALTLIQGAAAQQPPQPQTLPPIPDPLRLRLLHVQTRDQYIQRLVQEVRGFGQGRDWIDVKDAEAIDASARAALRAQFVARVLTFDLDEDNIVTRAEVEAVVSRVGHGSGANAAAALATAVEQIMTADHNKDGKITIEEMLRPSLPTAAIFLTRQMSMSAPLRALLALDPDKDGKLTVDEVAALAADAWKIADTDGDGKLSPAERALVAGRPVPTQQPATSTDTAPPVEIINVPLKPPSQPLSDTARQRLDAWTRAGLLRPATKADMEAWANGAGGPPDRFGRRFPPELIFPVDRTWVVLGELDFGSDFARADMIGLLLPAGTPLPRGTRGDGPLYRMDNFLCRGSFCPVPVPVARHRPTAPGAPPERPQASACRIEIPKEAMVQAVGAYESKQAARRSMRGNRPGHTDIIVSDTSRPVALYLTSYESMEWRIGVTPGVKIVGVFAMGYYDQVVTGVDAGVPVVTASRTIPNPCGIDLTYGYRMSEHGAKMHDVSRAIFGRDISGFKLDYYAAPRIVIGPEPQAGTQIIHAKDRGEPIASAAVPLPAGVEGIEALVARQQARRASDAELLAWVEGYERKTATRVIMDPRSQPWMITGATQLPAHPGGWANIFILPADAREPADGSRTWAILRMSDFTCVGRDCVALLGGLGR